MIYAVTEVYTNIMIYNLYARYIDICERFPGEGTGRFLKLFKQFIDIPMAGDESPRLQQWGLPPGSTVYKKVDIESSNTNSGSGGGGNKISTREDWANDVSSIGKIEIA